MVTTVNTGRMRHILVVPFPAQGHVMPLMEFSQKLVHHGMTVTFVNTQSIHNKLISTKSALNEGGSNTIHLVPIPEGLDAGNTSRDSKNTVEAILEAIPVHVEKLIQKMSDDKIDCVVADATVGGVLKVAEKFGIKRAAFWPAPLGVLSFMLHFPKLVETGEIDDKGNPTKEAISLPASMPAVSSPDIMWDFSEDLTYRKTMFTFIHHVNIGTKAANWILCNSFREVEPASHDFLPNILTIGPLAATELLGHPTGHLLPEDSTCLPWLDQQPVQSVVYIAFGSTTIFNRCQIDELVHGLELINQPFLWVFRPGLSENMGTPYSNGYTDTVAQKGKIVHWAPQQKVLAHPSIACFITHCGWNSTIEAVSKGVPLLCWPYVADQFHNQNYICDIWKVGLRLNKDDEGLVTGTEIKTKVQELLGDRNIRSSVGKLRDEATRNVCEGGLSSKNFEEFVKRIKG